MHPRGPQLQCPCAGSGEAWPRPVLAVSATGGTHRARGGGLDTEILVRALFEQTENAVDSLRRMEAMVSTGRCAVRIHLRLV